MWRFAAREMETYLFWMKPDDWLLEFFFQMREKLDLMRQKKQEYLQYQRQIALQRMQEQEREMQLRHEQAKQQYAAYPVYTGPLPMMQQPLYQMPYYPVPPVAQQQIHSGGWQLITQALISWCPGPSKAFFHHFSFHCAVNT